MNDWDLANRVTVNAWDLANRIADIRRDMQDGRVDAWEIDKRLGRVQEELEDEAGARVSETINSLSLEGLATAKRRGHKMRFWGNIPSGRVGGLGRRYECEVCGAEFDAQTKPMPNEADLAGKALALNCPRSKS